MKIAFGNDHAGPAIKEELISYLEGLGHEVVNVGSDTTDSVDYADYALPAAKLVAEGKCDFGVLICGTGIGMSLAANKVKGIRAAVCTDPVCARLCKQHNKANIITMGQRIIGLEMMKAILDAYLSAEFEGGRHQTRIDKIAAIENGDIS